MTDRPLNVIHEVMKHFGATPFASRPAPKFEKTFCSQCGGEFGPGDSGFSHCHQHFGAVWAEISTPNAEVPAPVFEHPLKVARDHMIGQLTKFRPHAIRGDIDRADIETRAEHIQDLRNAFDAYCALVIDDTKHNAPIGLIDAKYLNGLASDATKDIVGALANAAEDLAEGKEWDR